MRALATIILASLLATAVACESPIAKKAGAGLETIGLVTTPDPPAVSVDLLCDRPACNRVTLPQTLDPVLGELARRPGSSLREWLQGEDVTATTLVAECVSPAKDEASDTVRAAGTARFLHDARTALQQAVQPAMNAPLNTVSPIAESITKIALTPSTSASDRRVLIILSDARHVVIKKHQDWECGTLPEPETFIKGLHAEAILPPASLRGIDVLIAGAAVGPVDGGRCTFTLERASRIERLWIATLRAAGARSIAYLPGAPTRADLDRVFASGGSQ